MTLSRIIGALRMRAAEVLAGKGFAVVDADAMQKLEKSADHLYQYIYRSGDINNGVSRHATRRLRSHGGKILNDLHNARYTPKIARRFR